MVIEESLKITLTKSNVLFSIKSEKFVIVKQVTQNSSLKRVTLHLKYAGIILQKNSL